MGLRRLTTTDPIGRIYFRRRSLEGEPSIDHVLFFEQAANHVHRLGDVELMGDHWSGAYKPGGRFVEAQPGFALRREAAMWLFERWKADQDVDGESLLSVVSEATNTAASPATAPFRSRGSTRSSTPIAQIVREALSEIEFRKAGTVTERNDEQKDALGRLLKVGRDRAMDASSRGRSAGIGRWMLRVAEGRPR